MAHSDSTDSVPANDQLDMFGATSAPGAPDSEGVRAELADILAKVRAAPGAPWDPGDASSLRNIFWRMADRLPDEEAAQLRSEFEAEVARLNPA